MRNAHAISLTCYPVPFVDDQDGDDRDAERVGEGDSDSVLLLVEVLRQDSKETSPGDGDSVQEDSDDNLDERDFEDVVVGRVEWELFLLYLYGFDFFGD